MANNSFDFGIGISVDAGDAADVIGSVITSVEGLQNSMTSVAGIGLDQIFKGFDPSLLMPANDAIEDAAASLREIKGILAGLSGGASTVVIALGEAAKPVAEVNAGLEEAGANICGMTTCVEEVGEGFNDIPPKLEEINEGLIEFGKGVESVGDGLVSVASGIGELGRGIFNLSGALLKLGLSDLEAVSVKLGASLGQSRDQSMAFARGVTDLAGRTGLSVEAMTAMNVGMAQAGIRFDETTEAGRRQAETYAHLQETYGLGAEATRNLAGSMKTTGDSIEDLVSVGRRFEKEFQVPGLIAELPAVAQGAIQAQSAFGSLVGRSSKSIMVDVTKMAGVYSKAFGVTAAQGVQKALATFMKFTAEIESYEDLFLGLADDFTPLQTAFLETGMGLEDMEDLMRKAQKNPAAFAEEFNRIRDAMDPQMAQRFTRQVLRGVDETTATLLTQQDALKNASASERAAMEVQIAKQEEAAKEAADFNNVINEMRKSAVAVHDVFLNLLGVFQEDVKLDFADAVRQGLEQVVVYARQAIGVYHDLRDFMKGDEGALKGHGEMIQKVARAFKGFFETGEDGQSGVEKLISTVVMLGGGLAVVGGTVGVLMPVFSALGSVISGVWTVVSGLWTVGVGLTKVLSKMGAGAAESGGFFKVLSKTIGKLALPIAIAVAAFDNVVEAVQNIGAIMSDPSKSGMDKFKGVIGAVLTAAWGTFSDFFLGLPQMFVDGFMNVGKTVDTKGSESFGEAVGNILGKGLQLIKAGLGLYVDYMKWMFTTAIPTVIMAPFTAEFWMGLLSGLSAVGENILAFFKGIGVGILESFGSTKDQADADMDVLAKAFGVVGAQITMFFADAFANIAQVGAFVWHGLKEGFYAVRDNFMIGGAVIKDALSNNFVFVQMAALEVFKRLTDGMKILVDGALETVRTIGEALANVPGMGDISAGILSGVDAAQASVDGLSDTINAMIDTEEAANRARAASSASTSGKVIADLAAEKEARERAFDATLTQYAEEKAAREQVVSDKEKALVDAIIRQEAVTAGADTVHTGTNTATAPTVPGQPAAVPLAPLVPTITTISEAASPVSPVAPAGPSAPGASPSQVAAGAGSSLLVPSGGATTGGTGPQEIRVVSTLNLTGGDNMMQFVDGHLSSQSTTGSGHGR